MMCGESRIEMNAPGPEASATQVGNVRHRTDRQTPCEHVLLLLRERRRDFLGKGGSDLFLDIQCATCHRLMCAAPDLHLIDTADQLRQDANPSCVPCQRTFEYIV